MIAKAPSSPALPVNNEPKRETRVGNTRFRQAYPTVLILGRLDLPKPPARCSAVPGRTVGRPPNRLAPAHGGGPAQPGPPSPVPAARPGTGGLIPLARTPAATGTSTGGTTRSQRGAATRRWKCHWRQWRPKNSPTPTAAGEGPTSAPHASCGRNGKPDLRAHGGTASYWRRGCQWYAAWMRLSWGFQEAGCSTKSKDTISNGAWKRISFPFFMDT